MSAAKWIPGDDELDGLARTLPAAEPAAERAEQNRTRMLASAASVPQQSRSSRVPILAVSLSLAAAATALLWVIGRDKHSGTVAVSDAVARETIVAYDGGQFDRIATWPDYQVHVRAGRVSFDVGPVDKGERFRVTTADAEIEVRGTRFVIEAAQERLVMVVVDEGRVEVRMPSHDPVIVKAGESWPAPRTAQVEEMVADPTVSDPVASIAEPPTKQPAVTTPVAPRKKTQTRESVQPVTAAEARSSSKPAIAVGPEAPAPVQVKPSEAEFRRGWTLLRAGDAGGASKAFAKACSDAAADAREDACYWSGVAAKRAGQTSAARDALVRFLSAFPSSARAGEAAALLGWLLYDDGDLDGAERRFRTAAKDRVPSVRESAERGLTAIERRRKAP